MKIFSANQIRQADAFTIANEPISGLLLMERASQKCYDWIAERVSKQNHFYIFCGTGNNGGDGLVISRLLLQSGYSITTLVIAFSDSRSDDFLENEKALKQTINAEILYISDISQIPALSDNSVIIDAIFGTGLNKTPAGIALDAISFINSVQALVISIDIPSGLFCDKLVEKAECIVKADITLTFQLPKLAFLLPSNYEFTGEWYILDIGLSKEFIEKTNVSDYYIDQSYVSALIKPRTKFAHKGNYGHALLIAGSYGKIGAAVLGSKACLRSGAGLLTTYVPECAYQIIQSTVPEAMVCVDEALKCITSIPELNNFNAIAIGPGIGMQAETQKALKLLIQNSTVPLIIDADGLNILSENKTWLSFLPQGSLLTPHPKEFARLFGKPDNDYHRIQKQKECSAKFKCYIHYKGAHSTISTPEGNLYFNSSGNPGMASAGSGDVLTGILLGLKARGYSMLHSALIGVYLHGLAGDIASEQKGEESLIAGDIIDSISSAFIKVINQ